MTTTGYGFPRGHTWGRIETVIRRLETRLAIRFPRGHTWGRIETDPGPGTAVRLPVSPGVTPGGGLKQDAGVDTLHSLTFPPGSHLGAD